MCLSFVSNSLDEIIRKWERERSLVHMCETDESFSHPASLKFIKALTVQIQKPRLLECIQSGIFLTVLHSE